MSNNNDIITLSNNSIYDSMNNIITDSTTLTNLANQHINTLASLPNIDINSNQGITNAFNMILSMTPLQVGCCMRKQSDNTARSVLIRKTPSTPNKNGFQNKILSIPAGTCPATYYQGSEACDTFYDVYCANINKAFLDIYGPNFVSNDYVAFAPECACYAPRTLGEKQYPPGIPPACYKTNCSVSGPTSYPDLISRTTPCDLTICSSIINTAGMQAGGDATVTPTVTQQCGSTTGTTDERIGDSGPAGNKYLSTTYLIIYAGCFLVVIIIIIIIIRRRSGSSSGSSYSSRRYRR